MEPSSKKKKKEINQDPLTRYNSQRIVEATDDGKKEPVRHRQDSISGSDRPSSDEDEEDSRSQDGRRPGSKRRRERNGRHAARKRPRRRHTDSENGEEESSSGSEETSSDSEASSSVSESEEERERERRRRRRKRREKEREQERERDRRRRRKERHRKHQEKARKEEERKRREKKRKKEKAEKGKTGPVTDSWGKYGIIKEIDMWNKRPEFSAWLAEVKKVNLETLSAWEEKLSFKEYMEDFNTATLPKKYYDLDAYHRRKMMKEIEKGQKHQKQIERTEFNDEEQRRQELRREREQRKEAEVESLKRSMQSGMAQAMREQAQLREEMQYQYRLGNFEAAAAIQRRLDPDAPGATLK